MKIRKNRMFRPILDEWEDYDDLLDSDAISPEEEAFIRGWHDAEGEAA